MLLRKIPTPSLLHHLLLFDTKEYLHLISKCHYGTPNSDMLPHLLSDCYFDTVLESWTSSLPPAPPPWFLILWSFLVGNVSTKIYEWFQTHQESRCSQCQRMALRRRVMTKMISQILLNKGFRVRFWEVYRSSLLVVPSSGVEGGRCGGTASLAVTWGGRSSQRCKFFEDKSIEESFFWCRGLF